MRMLGVLLGCLLLLPSLSARACINEMGTDRNGRRFLHDDFVGDALVEWLLDPRDMRDLDKRARLLAAAVRTRPDFANRNDLAVVLIRYGKTTPAIRLLLANETLQPGHSATAANLGTALELAGFDEVALAWVRIGIARDANEHYGTEWLHARILEAKIALKKNPRHLDTHSVAGVDFGTSPQASMPRTYPAGNNGRPVTPRGLDLAFHYQLSERLQFVKPKDPVVANLLADWAALNLAGGPVENAEALYALAERYGAPRTRLLEARRERVEIILDNATDKGSNEKAQCPICVD